MPFCRSYGSLWHCHKTSLVLWRTPMMDQRMLSPSKSIFRLAMVSLSLFGSSGIVSAKYSRNLHTLYLGEGRMWVTWVTFDDTRESIVVYGTDQPLKRVVGNSTKFVDGGITRKVRYIHRVLLTDLQPGQRYGKRPNVHETCRKPDRILKPYRVIHP